MASNAATRRLEADLVSDEQVQILQELMNIAFGKAAADLADVMNMSVVLSVPDVRVLPAPELPRYLCAETHDQPRVSVVAQDFWGDFHGSVFLVVPSSESKDLIALLSESQPGRADEARYEPIDELESEALMEMGNIVIGACLGKLTQLLHAVVRYTAPSATIDSAPASAIPDGLLDADHCAVVLQTRLRFREHGLKGFMSIVSSGSSLRWLRAALDRFMAQHA